MDNKKVAKVLHSIANVFEQKNLDSNVAKDLLSSVIDLIGVSETEESNKFNVDSALTLIKKMEENDKIRTYKDKLKEVDPKYKEILSDMDKTREEVIQSHLKEFKLGLQAKDLINMIPNANDFKLPNGKTLEAVLNSSKSSFGVGVDNNLELTVEE